MAIRNFWTLSNSNGDSITSGFAPYASDLCLADDCYTVDMFDSYGDGWNGSTFDVDGIALGGLTSGDTGTFTFAVGTASNSLYLFSGATQGTQDVILPFGSGAPYTNGYFNFSSKFYVNPATGAYFNFQAENIPGVTWSLDVKMDLGTIVLENSGINYLTASYPEGVWFELKIVVDLTTNNWELFIDNQSLGSFTNTVNQIASLDLYPIAGHQFYVDDVCYEYSTTPYTLGCTDPYSMQLQPSS